MTNLDYLKLVMNSDFPIAEVSKEELEKSFKSLKTKDYKPCSNQGIDIIQHYYPSIWRCNIKNHLAPIDAWDDPEIMLRVINNRLKYKGEVLSPFDIRAGLTISKIAPKVSIFRPTLAKYLIKKYLNEFDTIFDPCSGFGGRLLGACLLDKKYIGQDINSITIKETKELIKDFNLNAEVKIVDSIYDQGEYDCLFTCPPYLDNFEPKEIWHQDVEPLENTDEWIDVCLKNYKCKKYLFVVDKTEKYKDYIVEEIDNTSHFGTNKEKVILIKKED